MKPEELESMLERYEAGRNESLPAKQQARIAWLDGFAQGLLSGQRIYKDEPSSLSPQKKEG